MNFSFDDNYAYSFSFDGENKRMEFIFESYYDESEQQEVYSPCKFVIKDWSSVICSFEYPNKKTIVRNKIREMPDLNLILDFKQQGTKTSIYAMGDDVYVLLELYDAETLFELININDRNIVFRILDELPCEHTKGYFVANIPVVDNQDDLLFNIIKSLRIPPHLSCNWNNLADIIRHPFWLGKWEHVAIIHESIALLNDSDVELYINIINKCRLHSLYIFFIFNFMDYQLIKAKTN